MPKMKQLLRKLHIGYDHPRLPEPPRPVVASNPNPSPTPSPSLLSTSPSSSDSIGRVAAAAVDSIGRDAAAAVNGGVDFNLMEEEFQVQLAMAISASDQGEDQDTAQIDAAKRISLGGSAASAADTESLVDFLPLRYWGHKVINYTEKVRDDFYDVYGISSSNTLSQGKMPLLVDLQAVSVLGNIDYEVILVNRLNDPELRELEKRAHDASLEYPTFTNGMVSSDLIQKLADIVVGKMGGRVGSADEMVKRWTLRSYELKNSLNSIILPIGRLDIGLARHRALLFKVLADRINLPCMLVKGSYYTGTDDGAVNLIKLDDGSEYIIDLMGAPGALIPTEVPSSCLPIFIPDARIVPEHLETLECSSLALDKANIVSDFPASMNKDFEIGMLKSNGKTYVGSEPSANDRTIGEKIQTDRFEHDFGKLMQSQHKSGENPVAVSERPSSAQKIKVKNVSKYVISAAKNPEFAQKLHAVLLESGASPPPDLFVDINPQELRELNMCGRVYDDNVNTVGSDNQCMPSNAYSRHEQVSSTGLRSQNDVICSQQTTGQVPGRQGECEAKREILDNPPPNTTAESYQWRVQTDSSEGYNGIERTLGVDNSKMSAIEIMETDTAMENIACSSHDQRGYPFLGEAAKWEIPWEDLQIGHRIGIGSYGEVYHADWNGTEVAVKKFLDQDFSGDALSQFKSEVEIMLRLRHPNVVLFMGAVTRRPHFSILTEFLPRGSLYRLLHRPNQPLEEKRRLRMALDVVKGMNYLHTSHPTIVHRDLKTPNLLVDKNWAVKVCDFGLSRMKHHTFLSSKSTAGTPEWMAPEVLRNERADEKCDVYSFGIILWELATLCVPWKGLNPMQVVGAVGFQNRRLEIPKDVNPAVAQIIRECWQTEPHLRPSFTQLMNRLKRIQRLTIEGTNSTEQSTM